VGSEGATKHGKEYIRISLNKTNLCAFVEGKEGGEEGVEEEEGAEAGVGVGGGAEGVGGEGGGGRIAESFTR